MYEWKDGELVTAAKLNDYSAGMEKFKADAETARDEAEAAKAVAEEKAAAAEQSAAAADAAKTAAENAKTTAQQSADTAAAAKEAAEAAKADAEAAKTAAENAKMTAQQSANTAAADKDAAEAAKADAEAAKTAAAQSEQNAASAKTAAENSAASAASDAQRAEDAVTHNPTIQNGIWYVWDPDQGKYVSTGVAATGQMTVEVTYQQGDSATTPPTGMWLDTPPEVAQGKYLWTKELFSDGTMGYSVARQGIDGTGAVVSVNGKSGEVTLTANDVGAATSEQGKKADNAVQFTSQTLTAAQKDQARTNIGAGTSNFSGSYDDLTDKPDIPEGALIVTITGNDTDGYTADKTFAEIREASESGRDVVAKDGTSVYFLNQISGVVSYFSWNRGRTFRYLYFNSNELIRKFAGSSAEAPTTLTSTLSVGSTTLTLSNTAITTSSTIDIYTDKWGVNPTDVAVEAGKITLTFDKQSAALGVKVEVR